MRFLHDLALRLATAMFLAAVALAGVSLIASPSWAQSNGTERLPAPARTQPGGAPANTRAPAAIAGRPGAPGAAAATPAATAAPGKAAGAAAPGQTSPAGQAPAGAAVPVPPTPVAPFTLSSREQELLDVILAEWEKNNSNTKTFKCNFRRWEYDLTIHDPKAKDHLRNVADGEVKYKRPDHGMFQVKELQEFDEEIHDYKKQTDGLEHWICDGKDIYEFVPDEKKLKVHPLPKEMQGEAIADGPVPFIFGAKADKMKQRYWIRDNTPPNEIGKHIVLEVYPKYQHDAVNFEKVEVMLNDRVYTIYGLQIFHPGEKQRTTFIFAKIKINTWDPLGTEFAAPSTPRNWTKEVDPVDEAPASPPKTAADAPAAKQAQRTAPPAGGTAKR